MLAKESVPARVVADQGRRLDMRLVAVAVALLVVLLVAVVVTRGAPALEARWRLQAGSPVVGSPAIEGANVFAATRSGLVVAVDAPTGEARWRFDTGERVMAEPVVEGGVVYGSTEIPGSDAGHIFAIDARTGVELWRHATAVDKVGAPAVAGGSVYFSAGDIVALDALSGEVRWRQAVEGAGAVSAGADVVVVSTSRGLVALDPDAGGRRWDFSTPAAPLGAVSLTGELVVSEDGAGDLLGVDALDGAERWRAARAGVIQTPVAGGQVVIAPTSDSLVAFATTTGEVLWRVGLSGQEEGHNQVRVATDGTLVAAASGGRLILFEAATGKVLGAAALSGEDTATPAVATGAVYVADGATVEAYGTAGGT